MLGIALVGTLDLTLEIIQQYRLGKVNFKTVMTSITKLCVDMGEGYLVGLFGQLAAHTQQLGDALPQSVLVIAVAQLLRLGIDYVAISQTEKVINERETKLNLRASQSRIAAYQTAGTIARTALQLAVVGLEFSYASPIMFATSQIVSAVQQFAIATANDGFNLATLKACASTLLPQITITAAGALVSAGVQWGLTAYFGAAITTTLGMGLVNIALPGLAFWGACKLFTALYNKWAGTPEERELKKLLQEYGLNENATLRDIKRRWRRLCLEKHPDKKGPDATAAFQKLNMDYDRITALHMMREVPNVDLNDENKVNVFRRAYQYVREMITNFRLKDVPKEEMEAQLRLLDETEHED